MSNIRKEIRKVIESTGGCFIDEINKSLINIGYTISQIKVMLKAMIRGNELRLKEDEIEHDWEYLKGSNW